MAYTSLTVLNDWRSKLGSVPPQRHDYVCKLCLGPVTNYYQCYGCKRVFLDGGAPMALRGAVVPMTSVLNPSPWYSALSTYKGFQPELGVVLAVVAHHFLYAHRAPIADALGGDPTILTLVPSKRGVDYATQPLRAALSLLQPLREQLKQTLQHRAGMVLGRREYKPEVFAAGPTSVRGERVILIEDTWVSGATAVSAAGALLQLGAAGVLVLPIARDINDSYLTPGDPYRAAMARPYLGDQAASWPRG